MTRLTPFNKNCIITFLTLLFLGFTLPVLAQSPIEWSEPENIAGIGPAVLTPQLIADSTGTVHAFVSDWTGPNSDILGIIYLQWTVSHAWTEPVDIILPYWGQARIQGVYMDQNDTIHITFWGGEDASSQIFYTRAPAQDANRASAWKVPISIGQFAITPESAAITGNSQGDLVVIYSGNLSGFGVYEIHSSDNGESWSEPRMMYDARRRLFPKSLQLITGGNGHYHAVWAVANETGNSETVYYNRLQSFSEAWPTAQVLAEVIEFEADTPRIIEHNDELMVVYHNTRPTTRWLRRSADNGQSWTPPQRLFPQHIGTNGEAAFAVDGNNQLHIFFGNRYGEFPAMHGLWHSQWRGEYFSPPRAITAGPREDYYDPARARAVTVLGNTLLVLWIQEPGSKEPNGVWFNYTHLKDVEPIPPAIYTATIHAPEEVIIEDIPETIDSELVLQEERLPLSDNRDFTTIDPLLPLGAGTGAAIVLIMIVLGIRRVMILRGQR